MKAICNREALLSACQLVSAAIPSKDIKPILKNIKAIAGEGRCTLMTTDLELGIRLDVQGLTITEPGEALLPAARLVAILRECRDDELSIETDTNTVHVRGASTEFELLSESSDSFPDVPTFTDEHYHEITAGTLREMIQRTIFATADDQGRYSMTGVLWELEDGIARLVGTDGKRLAIAQGTATAVGGHTTKNKMPVVPTKALSILERHLAEDAEETVRISLRPNEALFKTSRAVLYSRLIEGRFPDYKNVLPKKQFTESRWAVGALAQAVRQAAIMSEQDTKRVEFSFGKDKLTLQAAGATSGRSKAEVAIAYAGKALKIGFNPQYLLEMFRVLPSDTEIVADVIDEKTPLLLHADKNYRYLVMPLT